MIGRSGRQNAAQTAFDNAGSGIASDEVQGSLVELDGRSIFLRRHLVTADLVVQGGYFALWVNQGENADTVTVELADGATLELS